KYLPDIIEMESKNSEEVFKSNSEIPGKYHPGKDKKISDSIVSHALTFHVDEKDSSIQVEYSIVEDIEKESKTKDKQLLPAFNFLGRSLLLTFLIGMLFNYPFKRYFYLKRKEKKIPKSIFKFTKKWILKSAFINGVIFFLSLGYNLIMTWYQLRFYDFKDDIVKGLYENYFYISIIASVLAVMFVFFWENHRVRIKYIHHIYTKQELRKRIFRSKPGKIRNRIIVSSLMTSLLPLLVVMLYLFLSLTELREMNIDVDNKAQMDVVFGEGITNLTSFGGDGIFDFKEGLKIMFYFNAVNSMFMFAGIFTGILIAFIFLIFFVRWITEDIVKPVNDLLEQMKKTGKGSIDAYAIVRTNDEIGELTEGYNQMTERLGAHFDNISKMNVSYSRFVPQQFLSILGKSDYIDIKQGDQIEKEMTILFSDIRSFTELSESMTPKENFDFINRYLSYMEPVIGRNNGFIDKYIGDSIMALFNNIDDAVKASVEMRLKLSEFNQIISQFGTAPINSGIGVHTGNLMLGVVGGNNRIDSTVISDAVNLASRLEGLTKVYGGSIIISKETVEKLLKPDEFEFRFLDVVKVKGKKKPVTIFEVIDGEKERCKELKLAYRDEFDSAVKAYREADFESALVMCEDINKQNPNDKAVLFYISRCKKFIKNGVPKQWEGIEVFDY
ncbi:MAG: adenylate/guanylate cyclase domain-containing protein, partial [Bacteroidota bacterium]|nr:adenylate/guanylate cyclase domain-containing protein [Bacteroidota bacterium]